MKKLILFLTIFNLSFTYSQNDEKEKNIKNELKLNVASTINKYPEITYERLINEESSYGISVGFSIDNNSNDNNDETYYNFSVIPYYRFYFGKKPAAGFFLEANAPLFSQKSIPASLLTSSSEGGLGFGLGLSVGGKFLTKSGWIGEIYTGFGRSFINTDKVKLLYPRVGITIGKQF